MKVFWGVIAAAAAITALVIMGTSVLMKDLDDRHGNKTKKSATETTSLYEYYISDTGVQATVNSNN